MAVKKKFLLKNVLWIRPQDLNVLLLEPLLCCLGHVFWVIVMLESHPRPIFNALAGFNALALTVHGPIHRPFDAVQLSCPLSRKRTPKHNVSTSMFDGGDGVFWGRRHHSSSSKHGELSWCQRAGFWSHLTTTLSPSSTLNHWQTSDGPLHVLS